MKCRVARAPRPKRKGPYLTSAFVAVVSTAAMAQDQDQDQATPTAEVVVTGTRIASPNLESPSPVQVVTAEEIQLGGRMDASDMLNQLPQIISNSLGQDLGNRTSGLSTPGGVSTADLRGLGPNRTLVLVNGRRLGVGSPNTAIQSPAPNIDQIPTFLVDRVDVVTGGASAVYGSDAIAGVVNFILKRDFEGFQIDYHIGGNVYRNDSKFTRRLQEEAGYEPLTGTSKDGRTQTINIMAGTNFADGEGNITGYFSYHKRDPVSSADRDFGGCQLDWDPDIDGPVCAGSVNSNFFAIDPDEPYAVVGNEFVPLGSVPSNPPAIYNSQPFIFMSRDDERYMAGFFGHIDMAPAVRPYFEFHFMNDRTEQQVAPSALFLQSNPNDPTGNGNYNINCSNPFLSPQQQGILGCTPDLIAADQAAIAAGGTPVTVNTFIGRRNVEGGNRITEFDHTTFRPVGGVRGNLGAGWSYDAYAQYYYVDFDTINRRYLSFENIDRALLVTTDEDGNPVCVSGPPCVPYNIFQDGGVTQDAIDYLTLSGTARGSSTLRTLHVDFTGDLGEYGVKLPTADDPVVVNVGYEQRRENLEFEPDAAEESGQLAGFGGAPVPIDQSQTVDEGFLELLVPLMQGRPGVDQLLFGAGYRYSDYSITGSANTYKFDLQYAPTTDLRFRASFQRAIRAPSLIELFNPLAIGLIQFGTDPCAPTANGGPTATAEQCARTGLDPALYAAGVPQLVAGQITQLAGGNVELDPETANTFTFGVTFTPAFLPNFTGSLDYYDIDLKDGIGVFPAQVIMSNCLETGDPTFCSQIVRNAQNGSLNGPTQATGGYINQQALNIGKQTLKGIDLQATYTLPISDRWGDLVFSVNGVYIQEYETTPAPGVVPYDCAGLFGAVCQTVTPRWRHILRTSWRLPGDINVTATWRHFGKVDLDQNEEGNPTLRFATFGQRNNFNADIPAYGYLDLAGSWSIREGMQIRLGVNNVLDKNPPVVTSEITAGGAANTYEIYDPFGRELFAAFSVRF